MKKIVPLIVSTLVFVGVFVSTAFFPLISLADDQKSNTLDGEWCYTQFLESDDNTVSRDNDDNFIWESNGVKWIFHSNGEIEYGTDVIMNSQIIYLSNDITAYCLTNDSSYATLILFLPYESEKSKWGAFGLMYPKAQNARVLFSDGNIINNGDIDIPVLSGNKVYSGEYSKYMVSGNEIYFSADDSSKGYSAGNIFCLENDIFAFTADTNMGGYTAGIHSNAMVFVRSSLIDTLENEIQKISKFDGEDLLGKWHIVIQTPDGDYAEGDAQGNYEVFSTMLGNFSLGKDGTVKSNDEQFYGKVATVSDNIVYCLPIDVSNYMIIVLREKEYPRYDVYYSLAGPDNDITMDFNGDAKVLLQQNGEQQQLSYQYDMGTNELNFENGYVIFDIVSADSDIVTLNFNYKSALPKSGDDSIDYLRDYPWIMINERVINLMK